MRVLDVEAFLLSLVSVWDWADSGFKSLVTNDSVKKALTSSL